MPCCASFNGFMLFFRLDFLQNAAKVQRSESCFLPELEFLQNYINLMRSREI